MYVARYPPHPVQLLYILLSIDSMEVGNLLVYFKLYMFIMPACFLSITISICNITAGIDFIIGSFF